VTSLVERVVRLSAHQTSCYFLLYFYFVWTRPFKDRIRLLSAYNLLQAYSSLIVNLMVYFGGYYTSIVRLILIAIIRSWMESNVSSHLLKVFSLK
jgi:hypothetical protein